MPITFLTFPASFNNPMTGLIINLIHSTGSGSGDLPDGVASQGKWAGDRIAICTPEQLDDFEEYRDVGNPEDIEFACM